MLHVFGHTGEAERCSLQSLSIRKAERQRGLIHSRRFQHLGMTVEYPEKVRWKCVRCTMCCRDTSLRKRCIRILDEEVSRIWVETGLKAEDFSIPFTHSPPYTREMRKLNGRCVFLKDGLCSIYGTRPITCVFYPFFLSRISKQRFRFELTPEKCIGLGMGHEVSEKQFVRLFNLAIQRLKGEDET